MHEPAKNMFDHLEASIKQILVEDTFNRFKKTIEFKDRIREMEEKAVKV